LKILKKIELVFKDFISELLHFFLRQPSMEIPASAERILFFRYDVLGDMILSLPILRAIRETYPKVKIDVLCSPKNFKILENSGLAENLYIYKKNALSLIRLVFILRKNNYHMIINLVTHASFTFGLVARLVGPKSVRIAGHQEQFSYLYNHTIDLPAKNTTHMLKVKYLLCEEILGKQPGYIPTPWISYDRQIKDQAFRLKQQILDHSGNQEAKHIVGLNLSAGMARREWPLEKYARFLDKVIEKYDQQIDSWVILKNPADPGKADHLLQPVKHKKLTAIGGQNDFRIILELLPVFFLMVSPDTSIVHAASAMGVPVLVMTIGQSKKVWDPVGVPYVTVMASDYYSLADLPVNDVLAGFDTLFKKILK
jgi:ADP-heptose:LPS heptosyltransferase